MNTELRRLQIESLAAGRDLQSGISRGLLQIEEQFGDIADLASTTLVDSFQSAEDAFVEFTRTGKFSFKNLADSIITDLIRIQVRSSITGPLSSLLSSIGPIVGSFFGGTPSNSTYTPGSITATDLPPPGASFASGGSFMVNGQPGIDKNVVSFNASKGEMVNISKPGAGGGSPVTVVVNNNAPNTQASAREQQNGNGKSIEVMIDEITSKKIRQPGSGTNQAIRQTFGITQQLTPRS
jgi:hypothetical protein